MLSITTKDAQVTLDNTNFIPVYIQAFRGADDYVLGSIHIAGTLPDGTLLSIGANVQDLQMHTNLAIIQAVITSKRFHFGAAKTIATAVFIIGTNKQISGTVIDAEGNILYSLPPTTFAVGSLTIDATPIIAPVTHPR